MYTKILVPLDGSERAEVILPHVEDLARRYSAEVIFLAIIEPLFIGGVSIYRNPIFDQKNIQQQTQKMTEYLAEQRENFSQKDIQTQGLVGHGLVVEGILEVAQDQNVDLIAMASHGRTGLARVFYGSVTAGVLHRIDRPLLLIRSLDHQS